MSRFLALSCCVLLAAGCYDHNKDDSSQQTAFVLKKPVVAVVPVINNVETDVQWNLSEELTTSICSRLSQSDKIHLLEPQKIRALTQKLSSAHNPFTNDLTWVKKVFTQDDFVVFMELIRHEEIPVVSSKSSPVEEAPFDLHMSMRLRVLDMRGDEPRIALQEIIHETHRIARPFNRYNFIQVPWGENDYTISPLGMAHAQLSNIAAKRVQDYIQASLSSR